MRGQFTSFALGLVLAANTAPSIATQAPTGETTKTDASKAARDAKNWDVLQSMYPKRALANREEGMVAFTIKIDAAGSPTECKVTHTSGFPLLDQETCQLIMIHATFKKPEGISLSQQRLYEGVVNWKLPSTPLATVPAAPKPIAASAAPEPIICKRTPKVGTLAGFERTCMTQREWAKATQETQDWWQDTRRQGTTNCKPAC